MDGDPLYFNQSLARTGTDGTGDHVGRIVDFYEAATPDYAHWSRGLNMHLGFYRRGTNPVNRDLMLEQMNIEVASRLRLDPTRRSLLFDLGCGMGAVSRTVARYYPNAVIKGVTLAPSQVKIANEENTRAKLADRIDIFQGNYLELRTGDRSVDGVWAVESACYATGPDKADLIREMARVLKPGGRFVIADCFLKRPEDELNPFLGFCYRKLCGYWEVDDMAVIGSVVARLEDHGFDDIVIEDISWRIVPSLAHAPFAVSSFLIRKFRAGDELNRHSKNNLKASLLAPVLGMHRSKFSYYLISGRAAI